MLESNVNQKSIKKVSKEGRPKVYEQKKTTHNITVTPDGWEGVQEKALSLGYTSVSELIEQIGRGQVDVDKVSSSSGDDVQKHLSEFKAEMEQLIQKQMGRIINLLDNEPMSPNPKHNSSSSLVVGKSSVHPRIADVNEPLCSLRRDMRLGSKNEFPPVSFAREPLVTQ